MKVRIEIDTKTFIRFWLVVIAFVLAAMIIYSARVALIIIGLSAFLAVAFNPHVNNLAKHLPGKSRILSTALSYLIVVVILGVIVTLVVPPIVDQTIKFSHNVPSLIDSATKNYGELGDFIRKYQLEDQYQQIVGSIKDSVASFASQAGTNLISGIGSIVSIITSGLLIFVLTFLMIIEGPNLFGRLMSLYKNPSVKRHHGRIIKRIHTMISKYITGQLTVSLIAGIVAGLSVFVISMIFSAVPANLAVPSAAIIFVLSLVPLFGEFIGALLIGLILLLNSWTAAVIFLVFFILYMQIENNIIAPRIQSKRLNLTPLEILAAITIGIYLFGILGGIISVPIAGCIKILVEEYYEDNALDKATSKED